MSGLMIHYWKIDPHPSQAYTALGAFYVPLVITVVSYAAIFVLLWRKMRAKGPYTNDVS